MAFSPSPRQVAADPVHEPARAFPSPPHDGSVLKEGPAGARAHGGPGRSVGRGPWGTLPSPWPLAPQARPLSRVVTESQGVADTLGAVPRTRHPAPTLVTS